MSSYVMEGGALSSSLQPSHRVMAALQFAASVGGWLLTVLVLVVLVLVTLFYAGPKLMGWQGVIVLTGSMEPALSTGGVAFVDPIDDATELSVGDIITFETARYGSNRISHRITEIVPSPTGEMFRTKGDANDSEDAALVPRSDVIAKVRFHIPYLGYFAERMRDRTWFYVFLGIPALFIVLNEVGNIRRELKKQSSAPGPSAIDELVEEFAPAVDPDSLWTADLRAERAGNHSTGHVTVSSVFLLLIPILLLARWFHRRDSRMKGAG